METRAKKVDGGFLLNGSKMWHVHGMLFLDFLLP
jgi:alkylation response protein AidB-like acyl-CoA dehydrogenase